jgi:hypothetical protein
VKETVAAAIRQPVEDAVQKGLAQALKPIEEKMKRIHTDITEVRRQSALVRSHCHVLLSLGLTL